MSAPPKPESSNSLAGLIGSPKSIEGLSNTLAGAYSSHFTPDIAAILESVAKNPRDRVYKDQRVHLDGYTFTNCCFNNCVLESDSGIFALKACMIMTNCQFYFGPSALRIIKLFNLLYPPSGVAAHEVYNATNEAHGTVTVE
jgi:hypothetical protein